MEVLKPSEVPTGTKATKVETKKVLLKNVITATSERDIEAEVIPFNKRVDAHVDFALETMDMMSRLPSRFINATEAAQEYVRLFMVHKAEDEANVNSDFYLVLNDKRAARTLFNSQQKEITDFFVNA